ncbi:MAG: hypothetical protein JNJ54_11355 [Myxococcaceae bacterium]|nr:hypothetical protein [Myxococcaceae bacterium]
MDMTPSDLKPYEALYRTGRLMGANRALREFLGWPEHFPLPLSISHGVDFGHCFHPMDVDSAEPIHWATNERMVKLARMVKPSILAPHPWALLTRTAQLETGKGVLVIGPPPSPANDSRLHDLIRDYSPRETTILVKARGAYRDSIAFWQNQGFHTITAESQDGGFYQRLHSILSAYERIVSPTFSSAAIFAAALGKAVDLLRGFSYTAYEPADYENEVNLSSPDARAVVKVFCGKSQTQATQTAQDLLGFGALADSRRVRNELLEEIQQLQRPVYANPKSSVPVILRQEAARLLNKPGLLRFSTRQIVRTLRRKHICIMQINEIDVWLHGKTDNNFTLTPVPYMPGVTVPGAAPAGYSR